MTYAAARRFRAGAGRGSSLPAAFSCRTLLVETRSTYFAEHSQQVFISRMCVKNSTSGFFGVCGANRLPPRVLFVSNRLACSSPGNDVWRNDWASVAFIVGERGYQPWRIGVLRAYNEQISGENLRIWFHTADRSTPYEILPHYVQARD